MHSLKEMLKRLEGQSQHTGRPLRLQLTRIIKKSLQQRLALYGILIALLALIVGFSLYHIANVQQATTGAQLCALLVGFGIVCVIEVVRWAWRSWIQTKTLLDLVSRVPEPQLLSMLVQTVKIFK